MHLLESVAVSCFNFCQAFGTDSLRTFVYHVECREQQLLLLLMVYFMNVKFNEANIQIISLKWFLTKPMCCAVLFCVFVEVLGSICIAFQIKTSYTTNTQLFFSVFICNGIRIMAHTFSAMNVSNVSMLGEDDNKYIINSIMICQFVFSLKKNSKKKRRKNEGRETR